MYSTDKTALLIKNTAKEKGINIGDMLKGCELNRDAISLMTRRGSWLQSNNLAKIADYLEVSVDYLLGRTENPKSHLSGNAVSVGDVSGNNIIGNGSVGNVTVNAPNLDDDQKELIGLYGKLSPLQKAKVMVLINDVADGKADL